MLVVFGTLNLALLVPLLHVLFKGTGDVEVTASEVITKPTSFSDLGGWFTYYTDKLYYDLGPYEALKYVCVVISFFGIYQQSCSAISHSVSWKIFVSTHC
ncbi:hypothetical protein [Sphingobacterium sp. T2]|uniref:hypothetical protein n=1 Tax=Sphingobacterium sp. T2 TaxID=1590596 RepID=UPI002934E6EA|nr:hypothetical protein [Sphingobacterium sp. T2]